MSFQRVILSVVGCLVLCGGDLTAQQATTNRLPPRFEFQITESIDSHLTDALRHRGKGGGLEGKQLDIALGDPVYRGTTKIGTVTTLIWSPINGVLHVEFSPVPSQRISIGDRVWVSLNGSEPKP